MRGSTLLVLWATAASAAAPTLAQRVEARVKAELPAARVTIVDDDDVVVVVPELGKTTLNLENARKRCAAVGCETAIDEVIASLRQTLASVGARPDPTQLRVRLSDDEYLGKVRGTLEAMVPEARAANQPVARELARGLWLVLGFDTPDSIRLATRRDATALAQTDDTLFALALENLRRALPKPDFRSTEFNPRIKIQSANTDGYDSAYVALPDLILKALGKTGGQVLIAVPARDILLVADLADAAALRQAAERLRATADHPVFSGVFTLTAKGLKPL